MKRNQWIIFLVALVMIGGVGASLNRLRASQRLGAPGIKTVPIANSQRLDLFLPEQVLNYGSELVPTDPAILEGLPHDTSFLQRRYYAHENSNDWLALNIVLMGTDRTSIHKPQFCLRGSGWDFNDSDAVEDTVSVGGANPYDLPIAKIMMSRTVQANGQAIPIRGIFVYWFVADNDLTASHWARMRKSAVHLLKTGELERWAYIGCLTACLPGQEEATYQRMKLFLAAAVPEFQMATSPTPAPSRARADARRPN